MPISSAIPDPTFMPAVRLIAGITNAPDAVVTTTFDHGYIDGTLVRLDIPSDFGMIQADGLIGAITVTGLTTFTITINTVNFDPFVVPSVNPLITYTPAQVVPVGELNETLQSAFRNIRTSLF